MPKMILIEKDYHMNLDIEQKRPLILARGVVVKAAPVVIGLAKTFTDSAFRLIQGSMLYLS